VDLTPKDGAVDPIAGLSGFVPGWTATGHPSYWECLVLYRIRVGMRAGEALALAGPSTSTTLPASSTTAYWPSTSATSQAAKPKVYHIQPKMFPQRR
jgi:hypothetical protein